MQNFYYNNIKNKNNTKAEMLLTDTDSLTYITETENIYQDIYEYKRVI